MITVKYWQKTLLSLGKLDKVLEPIGLWESPYVVIDTGIMENIPDYIWDEIYDTRRFENNFCLQHQTRYSTRT